MGLDLTAVVDGYVPVPPVMLRVTAERLVDQLDLVDRHVWIDREIDRDWLRAQTSVATSLALALLDAIPPVR
jgi:hypothetical protein